MVFVAGCHASEVERRKHDIATTLTSLECAIFGDKRMCFLWTGDTANIRDLQHDTACPVDREAAYLARCIEEATMTFVHSTYVALS